MVADTTDTNKNGDPITIANSTVNVTNLYYNNQTDYLYIRIECQNDTGDISSATWVIFLELTSGDWLIKETDSGLDYYKMITLQWTLQASEGVDNVTSNIYDGHWCIDFRINKSIIGDVEDEDRVGIGVSDEDDLSVAGMTVLPTQFYLKPNWLFDDILEHTTIPEFSGIILPVFISSLMYLCRKRRQKPRA